MGALATPHARLEKHLSAELLESQRIRRVACRMEYRDRLRDLRLAQAFTRRRLTDLRLVRQ
jgi:hypothetical protein